MLSYHKNGKLLTLISENTSTQGDECGGLAEFDSGSSINYSFSNFSFKVFPFEYPKLTCIVFFFNRCTYFEIFFILFFVCCIAIELILRCGVS